MPHTVANQCAGVKGCVSLRWLLLLRSERCSCSIALGPQQGRKVFTLQTLPDCESGSRFADTMGKVGGFSLYAGVAAQADERNKVRA